QSGRCLDVSEVKPDDGQQIHIWDCLAAANQLWTLP
ncbi:RICIN domain-containing protein, partial [Actinoplanes siamensis]